MKPAYAAGEQVPRAGALAALFLLPFLALPLAGQTANQQKVDEFWDKIYTSTDPIFTRRPNSLLVTVVEGRPPGKALDIGMGQGRNAIFLARRGWRVTGFDPSREGVRQARAEAQRLRVPLEATIARYEDVDLGTNAWDLIVMTYVRRVDAADAERVWHALRVGGLFVYENNNVSEHTNDVLKAFLKFRILRFEEVEGVADWNRSKASRIERLVTQRQ